MNKRDKAIAVCKQALAELEFELGKEEAVADLSQLLHFKEYVERILWQLETERLPPKSEREFGMGRLIVDSWPLDSKLGNLLCAAEQAYREE